MKTDFHIPIFTDECRATLDGPDCWSSGGLAYGDDEIRDDFDVMHKISHVHNYIIKLKLVSSLVI